METVNLDRMELAAGAHPDRSNGLCAMEVVAWLAGEPHSDHPICACPVVSAFVRCLNDQMPTSERQRLKPYLTRLVNSVGSTAVRRRRTFLAVDFAVREAAVLGLWARGRTADADRLAALAPIVDQATASAAAAAYADAAVYAAAAYADAAAYAAAAAAAYAAAAPVWTAALACLDRMLAVTERRRLPGRHGEHVSPMTNHRRPQKTK
jgi:pyruvate/2-oxoglutarate dehydrogenase complex dihydrolipoamide acyltransferase (E2) component